MRFSPNTYHTHPNNSSIVIKRFIARLSLYPALTFSQTTFQEKATEVGIDHYFPNGNLMNGSFTVLELTQDGWEYIWIKGDTYWNLWFQNNGNDSFSEIGKATQLGPTANYRTKGVIRGNNNRDGFRFLKYCI